MNCFSLLFFIVSSVVTYTIRDRGIRQEINENRRSPSEFFLFHNLKISHRYRKV